MADNSTDRCIGSASVRVKNKTLCDQDVENFLLSLDNGDLSDVSSENEDDDEIAVFEAATVESESVANNENISSDEENRPPLQNKNKRKPPTHKWKKKVYEAPDDITWKDGSAQNNNISELESPYKYFLRYIPESFFERIAEQTNIYSVKTSHNNVNTNPDEIRSLFAMHIVIGILKFPRLRLYWNPLTRIASIADTMPRNRFDKLRNNLHVITDKPASSEDRLWKVRPLIDSVNARCRSLHLEENTCIDEQMIPFKGKLSIKQYIQNKPSPWGIKSFVLCGASGIVYDFILYQGKTTPLDPKLYNEFGMTGAVVLHLCERIPDGMNYKLFADNFFTSIKLIQHLTEKKILYAGTIRKNRTNNCPLLTTKRPRGDMEEIVNGDGNVVITQWFDNNVVNMASNFIGKGTVDSVQRWNKSQKLYMTVQRPEVIKLYNQSMGGVDKTDFLIQLYRIFIRSRKWTLRVIFHYVTMSITNSWLEYKRDAAALDVPKKNIMDLLSFTFEVAEALAKSGKLTQERKRGRPSSAEIPQSYKKRLHSELRPIREVRYDNIGHWPTMDGIPQRCKMELCTSRSRIRCGKCNVHLCLSSAQNCFTNFHTK